MESCKSVKVKYLDYGLAFRVGDTVYLNEKLKEDPVLHDYFLLHETAHSSGFSLFDFLLDSRPGLTRLSVWKFLFKNPSAFWNFSPLLKVEGVYRFDVVQFVLFFIILCGAIVLSWLL